MDTITVGIEFVPSNAFGRAFIEGASAYAAQRRNWKFLAIRQSDVSKATFRRCNGVIMRVLNDRTERLARESDCQLVDLYCSKQRLGIGQITSDDRAAGRLAAELFLSRGFSHFAYCGINALAYSDLAFLSFAQQISASGHEVHQYGPPKSLRGPTVFDDGSPDKVPDLIELKHWLKTLPTPTAIFCCNDHRAYQVLIAALQIGLNIPYDISVLGCDNDATICSFAPVPLSSIDPDAHAVGFAAARMLDAMIQASPKRKPHRIVTVPPKGLVERTSTECAPFDPSWLAEAILEIDRELANGISAEHIFRLSQHSPPYVEKVFRKKLNMSVQSYITQRRLQKATKLLSNTTLSIKAVAAESGYSSVQYFCRVFKAHFGKTPQTYFTSIT